MNTRSTAAGLFFALISIAPGCRNTDTNGGPARAFINGRWFNGSDFVAKTMYAVNGKFVAERPARIDTTVDLTGRFVVPPYAEAHNHNLLGDSARVEEDTKMYLSQGVFYAMNMDPLIEITPDIAALFNAPGRVDIVYTQGVVTASWSIIADMYSMLGQMGRFGGPKSLSELDTKNVFIIDTKEDLERKWELLRGKNKDFLKVIVAFSEEFELRKENPKYGVQMGEFSAKPGIDPKLLPLIVRNAHEGGLRVSVHIETAADFRRAVEADADIIAHLPGSWQIGAITGFADDDLSHWILTEDDAARAAAKRTIVITTTLKESDHPSSDKFRTVHSQNLQMLSKHSVNVVLGSDNGSTTALDEAFHINTFGVFDNRAILNMLSKTTSQAIFPNRAIGSLQDGYEASFLALDGNPLEDLQYLRAISLRVKQGELIQP